MAMYPNSILQVALPAPVMRIFDYLLPAENEFAARAGQRVRVPFGKSTRVGVLIGVGSHTEVPRQRLRHALEIIDSEPVLDEHVLQLAAWAGSYYHHPPGEVFAAALPKMLRRGGALIRGDSFWELTDAGRHADVDKLHKRAPVQAQILEITRDNSGRVGKEELQSVSRAWRQSLAAVVEKGYLEERNSGLALDFVPTQSTEAGPALNHHQRLAVEAINASIDYCAYLLEGVTGSGKTEVYLRCIKNALEQNRQSLILVPEIGLTPQLLDRFRTRLDVSIATLHSGMNDTQRLQAWSAARDGSAAVIIGTRSAVFTPLARPGLIIVDEEHDGSLKQQDGFRYSARDLAVWRARNLDIPVILGSATPSFESLENVATCRYSLLSLPERAGGAQHPDVNIIDLGAHAPGDGLSQPLTSAVRRHLAADGQILLYLNRRGFAPVLMCRGCGNITECRRCDARMVVHQGRNKVICHHCGTEQSLPSTCPDCGEALFTLGHGTERIEETLNQLFPEHPVVRIDRDTTRRRGEIERRLAMIRRGDARILLGTQMLTKGHDFPGVTLVGIIDADQGLFGTDFRSSERLAQAFIQVSGRAGRADRPGEVFIQTWFPDHPLLQVLIQDGYSAFARQAMDERRRAGWPPFTHLALLRAESVQRDDVFDFLNEARSLANELTTENLHVLGPAPAPMERRAGRYRAQLLIQGSERSAVHRFLRMWRNRLDALKSGRRTRWSLDIDPIELF